MRVNEFLADNTSYIQIYLNTSEMQDKLVVDKIEEIKKNNINVVLFISGSDSFVEATKKIVSKTKEYINI